jgi:hypothetical protein
MTDRGLLNQESNQVEEDKSIAKISTLAGIAVVFSLLFGFFLKSAVLSGSYSASIWSFSFASLFLAFYFLNAIFIKSTWRSNLIIFLECAAFLVVFYDMLSVNLLLGALVSFLVLVWGNHAGRDEMENALKIKFWQVAKRVLPKAVFALALFVGVAYAGTAISEKNDSFVSQTTFDRIARPALENGLVRKFFPGFDASLPAEQLFESMARSQVEKSGQLSLLPESAKNLLVSQAAKETEQKISEFFGITLNSNLDILSAIYGGIIEKSASLSDNQKMIFPITVAALLFLIIVGLTLPIRWIISLIAFLFYEIFLALGFSELALEGRSREIILLK